MGWRSRDQQLTDRRDYIARTKERVCPTDPRHMVENETKKRLDLVVLAVYNSNNIYVTHIGS